MSTVYVGKISPATVLSEKEFEQIVQILEAAYNGDWKGAEKDEIFGLRSQTL